ncbi:hypothetical protein C7212DRAFT_282207 [Tuber magnatum]|uniref:Nudix hydrolase domain-containing protein n=1 Tax=Tuber magnatum TaxID=42249 RepID=A0A317SNH5_9PEZI|nr:hypothetical protein C7212DRAFT_282207 [Tuber magnatum]
MTTALLPTTYPTGKFILAASTCTYHIATSSIVLVHNHHSPSTPRTSWNWFLPRGRKDINESIHAAAIRETCEESGYTPTLLATSHNTLQPGSDEEHVEAFHMQLIPYFKRTGVRMYVAFYYLATIAEAVRAEDYGSGFDGRHEAGYESEVVKIEEAVELLSGGRYVLRDGEVYDVLERKAVEVDGVAEKFFEVGVVVRGWREVQRHLTKAEG